MPKYPTISGTEAVKNLCKYFGGSVVHQKGSPIKIKFISGRITIVPNHKEIDRFTLKGVLDLAGISLEDFYQKIQKK